MALLRVATMCCVKCIAPVQAAARGGYERVDIHVSMAVSSWRMLHTARQMSAGKCTAVFILFCTRCHAAANTDAESAVFTLFFARCHAAADTESSHVRRWYEYTTRATAARLSW